MRYLIYCSVFTVLFLVSFQFSYAQPVSTGTASNISGQGVALLLEDNTVAGNLANVNSLSDFLNLIVDFAVTLTAVWAVIEITYYGAKYVLVDSFTGKSMALSNLWPIVYGLVALLSIYIIFKQINPDLLNLGVLKYDAANSQPKQGVTISPVP